jgi:hypothetical protein
MTNVKAQISNECQMPKPKTNNHETIRRRLPSGDGQLWRGRQDIHDIFEHEKEIV